MDKAVLVHMNEAFHELQGDGLCLSLGEHSGKVAT